MHEAKGVLDALTGQKAITGTSIGEMSLTESLD
jgi:hypothetical protein